MRPKSSKAKKFMLITATVIILLTAVILVLILYTRHYTNPADEALTNSGIEEKQYAIGDVNFNYAEGPDNGAPLLLLHAQLLDWYTYSEVLPELSKSYHVFAVDYPGHGKTTAPEDYVFSANEIGKDLAAFIEIVIGEPTYVAGNSSGGLLALWLAVNDSDYVSAVLLEDPPLFSSEYPEIKQTIAYRSFTTSNTAISNGYDGDFLMYWIDNSTKFFQSYTGPFGQPLIRFLVNQYRDSNPDAPIEIALMPPVVREMIRGLNYYDPAFGNAFYEGSWNEGFDHTDALSQVECPVLLIQADYDYTEDGILNGAMSGEMAKQATDLISDCTYVTVDSNHVVNLDNSQEYIRLLTDFFK